MKCEICSAIALTNIPVSMLGRTAGKETEALCHHCFQWSGTWWLYRATDEKHKIKQADSIAWYVQNLAIGSRS